MKNKLTVFLKYNKAAYTTYYYVASFFVNVLKIIVKPDEKLLLFNSYAGRKYDDSPKTIFNTIKNDPRFEEYKCVWAFHDPKMYSVDGADIIKTNSLKYFTTALAARVWITNSSVERGLSFKGKNTLYVNTWHGTPIKKMGSDLAHNNQSFVTKATNRADVMNVQSEYEKEIFERSFALDKKVFLKVGLPRNDELVNHSKDLQLSIKNKLHIPNDKRIILYCPTFREYDKDSDNSIIAIPPVDFLKWEKELGHQYVLLFRAHYEVAKTMGVKDDEFIRNVTNYPTLNDLLIASDILISDYSSIFFDYSIMDKVMLHFTYDYDRYNDERGLYFDIREHLNGADNEDDLIKIILTLNEKQEIKKTASFRNLFMQYYGDATTQTVNKIAELLLL